MERAEIKAYRYRLRRYGYKNVHIYTEQDGKYLVVCIDPRGVQIRARKTLEEIVSSPYVTFFWVSDEVDSPYEDVTSYPWRD